VSRRGETGGAKIQISLTLTLEELVKVQRLAETEKLSLSKIVQRLVSDGLTKTKG
jgi:hypothetical protein